MLSMLSLLGAALVVFAYHRRLRRMRGRYSDLQSRSADAIAALHSVSQGYVTFPRYENHEESLFLCKANNLLQHEFGLDEQACDFQAIAISFNDPQKQTVLLDAVRALRLNGMAFDMSMSAKGRRYELRGQRVLEKAIPELDVIWFHDVTVQHRLMNNAEERAARMSMLLDSLPLPVWMRDRAGTLIYCNLDYSNAINLDQDEILATGAELLGRNKQKEARSLTERAFTSADGNFVYENHHVIVNGERRLLCIGETRLNPDLVLGFAQNYTPFEELKTSLSLHEKSQSQLLENLGIAISIFGADMRLAFSNSAYASLFHLSEDFLASRPSLGELLDTLRENRRLPEYANFPEFKRQRLRSFQTLLEPEEELLHLPDGSTLRLVSSPHFEGGVIQAIEDVTDRLALERSYNTLTEVQRETIDKLYEAVAVYGADGRLKLFNPAFCEIWDLEAEFLLREPHIREVLQRGKHFYGDESETEWNQKLERMVTRVLEGGPRSGRIERTDGHVLDWAQVMLPDGSALLTFLDVTASTEVERALLDKNEALETADRLKTEFIANISYELRTPLNAIVGFAEILDNQFFGTLNERQAEYSQAIVESSQRLMTLINDILDLATIEAGYLQLELRPVRVQSIFDSLKTMGHERARNRGVLLVLDCSEELDDVVLDERRVTQALFNLMVNALKYSQQGDRVEISAFADRSNPRNESLVLRVRDQGSGIAPEDQQRIFEKFERGSTESKLAGAGLGLSLVKSLVELHGGAVELKSELGRGTTVTCRLPLDNIPEDSEGFRPVSKAAITPEGRSVTDNLLTAQQQGEDEQQHPQEDEAAGHSLSLDEDTLLKAARTLIQEMEAADGAKKDQEDKE